MAVGWEMLGVAAVDVTELLSKLIFGRLPDGVPITVPPLYS